MVTIDGVKNTRNGALEMKHHAKKDDEVVMVSDSPTFYITSSNRWVGFGWRTPGQIIVPLAPVLKRRRSLLCSNLSSKYTGGRTALSSGMGPHGGLTKSVFHIDHAAETVEDWKTFCGKSRILDEVPMT